MARHRNIRTMNYDEEIDDYSSDDYGTSFENGCVTPETESLYTYSRERLQSMSKIWEPHNPPVKEEDENELAAYPDDDVIDTSQVAEADRQKFFDCLDKMRSVIGDSEPENVLCEAAKSQNFDPERALEVIFSRRSGEDKPVSTQGMTSDAVVAQAVPLPNTENNHIQSEFSIEALLSSNSHGMDIDALLSGRLPSSVATTAVPNVIADSSCGVRPLHGSPSNLVDTIETLMDSSLTLDDLLGTSHPVDGLDLKQLLAGNSGNKAKEQAGQMDSQISGKSVSTNKSISVTSDASTTDSNYLLLSMKVTDALDELLRASEEQKNVKGVPPFNKLAPSQSVSAMSRVLLKLERRDDGVVHTLLQWYKGLYLKQKDGFVFGVPSPDDLVRNARIGETFCGVKKPSFPEIRPLKQPQTPLISVPPVEVPTRMTFSGKDSKESYSKTSKAQPGKDGIPRGPKELKVEQELNHMPRKLSPDTPKVTASPKAARHSKTDPKVVQDLYDKKRAAGKPLLNLVVVGHVDAGKSTLMGHLLYLTGNVNKKTMDKYEHESKKFGKASFVYAWVLDETPEERSRGITMDIAHAKLETKHRSVNILDAPGHKEFIPNMITGAAQADVGILVVNATRGEFETGFESGGQTREHTTLIRSLGVCQLAVVVNKLDTCAWSKERFNEIVSALKPFLKKTGFGEKSVWYVPCSGLAGDNLHERSQTAALTAWYRGPCLLEVIDSMTPPVRAVTRPLRMCVTDVFKGVQSVGVCVSGRIESGSLAQGDRLIIMPAQENCVVKAVTIDESPQQRSFAGDNVVVTLDKCDPANIVSGSVLCDLGDPIRVVTKFEAKVVIFNVDVPVIKGFPVVLHFQAMSEQAHFGRLLKEVDRNSGEVIREKPRCLGKKSSGVVVIKVARPICLELYQDSKELGRITLRQGGHTIAGGIVTALL